MARASQPQRKVRAISRAPLGQRQEKGARWERRPSAKESAGEKDRPQRRAEKRRAQPRIAREKAGQGGPAKSQPREKANGGVKEGECFRGHRDDYRTKRKTEAAAMERPINAGFKSRKGERKERWGGIMSDGKVNEEPE